MVNLDTRRLIPQQCTLEPSEVYKTTETIQLSVYFKYILSYNLNNDDFLACSIELLST